MVTTNCFKLSLCIDHIFCKNKKTLLFHTFIKIKMLFYYTFIKINPFSIHYNCPIGQIGCAQGAVNNVSSANHFPLPD